MTVQNDVLSPTYVDQAVTGKKKKGISWQRLLLYIFLISFTLIYMSPFFSAVITSVRTMDDIALNGFWSIPQEITLQNYIEAWTRGNVSRYLLNSFIITIPALIGTIFLSSLSAFALARYRFRGNRPIFFMYVAGTMLPFQILLLPVFLLMNKVGLYNSYEGVILIHIAFQLGFCTFVLRNFMRTLPGEIFDAARIDGASEFGIWWRIAIPLTVPAIAAIAVLEFTWIFNDYLWALILIQDDKLKPVTAGLASLQGQFITNWPLVVSGALLAAIPTLAVFFLLQRYFIGGLTLGSTK
ncbi:MAG: ABC transporter permease subunit [Chloroflexi bacterium]|jgi:multiple sugar transport system permease protein|nr:ABC transporter permease subunit [Chloroflexota bacterium]